ncbi:helix-turn-helix domain-containing protein [Sinorhizobium medicae]|uniref:Transcriptional regulator, XRE family n=3 Tax=Sinorhizobium medicae TaxID=110321 RepID=A6UF59_SINMW|nr:transcriptional regulator, XRE family [Sinorhizobium medicae WSM419]MDX0405828.1 helix-turn-helix domain-containing protein [Sinorhizobium medicae]MDX0411389.1 helix-turn-helix domain-containing protein [Sinorhizobium medicae]MDX0418366.1 helix-turn-helix domain-containing protein [Sinorhizobium medicae]MDX0421935.1 helix-turn-helix domain-containing protein [Sinorhizobium medicae]
MQSLIMENLGSQLDEVVGMRVRALRAAQDLTLDDLANRAGVSRAMISRIERGEASPTAQLLARLCSALGTTLSALFASGVSEASPLARRQDQRLWRDPESGYLRRSVSPEGVGSPIDIVEVEFPPGARVVFERQPMDRGITQHLWLFSGRLELTMESGQQLLEPGDCLFMGLEEAHIFHNPYEEAAHYAIVLCRNKV